jgi:hypothetical protein
MSIRIPERPTNLRVEAGIVRAFESIEWLKNAS